MPKSTFTWLPVTTLSNGCELRLPLHTLTGARPGPTLGLSAAVHGNEVIPSVGTINAILDRLDPAELSGRILAVPICNPLGAGEHSRNTPLDGRNLNTAFLDTDYNNLADLTRAVTQQIAAVLTKEFLTHLDYHIDFHTGGANHCVHSIDFGDDPLVFGMARAFNQPILMRDYWLPEQIWGMSDQLGIKMICAESGGGGQLYEEWLERNVRGTFNVMRQLGMLPGEVERPPKQYVVDRTQGNEHNLQVRLTREGGLIIPDPKITARLAFMGEPLGGVTILGKLQNMYDLTIRQEIENPFERTLLLGTPVSPSFCNPGDLVFLLADADAAEVLD